MKKLLSTAAVCGLVVAATPAHAQVDLDFGGWFKGYGAYVDQDENVGENRDFDLLRGTEVHFGGETTLDNGLTVGVHFETEADGADSLDVQESYIYLSGGWGRVNAGAEDGAAYLLQVNAPSADENIDGIRQFIQPVNYAVAGIATPANFATTPSGNAGEGLDYDQDLTNWSDKLTYLSPVFSGFQVGLSYVPDAADNSGDANDLSGVRTDNVAGRAGSAYEVAARYEGTFENVGVILGAGYTQVEQEDDAAAIAVGVATDDRTAWNVGLDLDIGPFGIGASYSEDDNGEVSTGAAGSPVIDDTETLVIGVDYTTGPFKIGASYFDQDNTFGVEDLETQRYTGGVVYTYGPGMTFRGSISHVEHDNVAGLPSGDSFDATSVLLGTQINF